MRKVRQKGTKDQRRAVTATQQAIPLDDGTVTTPAALAMIRALIPLGLKAVEEALVAEVTALAGPRYARHDARPGVVRWGAQPGSIYLADQQLPITVPRVRDRAAQCEVPLATYAALQTPRAQEVGLFRKVLGGLSCREYEAAAEAVPEAFGLAVGEHPNSRSHKHPNSRTRLTVPPVWAPSASGIRRRASDGKDWEECQ